MNFWIANFFQYNCTIFLEMRILCGTARSKKSWRMLFKGIVETCVFVWNSNKS